MRDGQLWGQRVSFEDRLGGSRGAGGHLTSTRRERWIDQQREERSGVLARKDQPSHASLCACVPVPPPPPPAGSCWNDPVCPTPGFQLRQVLWPHVLGCGTKWRGSRGSPCSPRVSADAVACHPAPCQVPSARACPQPHAALHELRGAFPGTLLSLGPKRGDSLRLERSVLRGSGLVWVL